MITGRIQSSCWKIQRPAEWFHFRSELRWPDQLSGQASPGVHSVFRWKPWFDQWFWCFRTWVEIQYSKTVTFREALCESDHFGVVPAPLWRVLQHLFSEGSRRRSGSSTGLARRWMHGAVAISPSFDWFLRLCWLVQIRSGLAVWLLFCNRSRGNPWIVFKPGICALRLCPENGISAKLLNNFEIFEDELPWIIW